MPERKDCRAEKDFRKKSGRIGTRNVRTCSLTERLTLRRHDFADPLIGWSRLAFCLHLLRQVAVLFAVAGHREIVAFLQDDILERHFSERFVAGGLAREPETVAVFIFEVKFRLLERPAHLSGRRFRI